MLDPVHAEHLQEEVDQIRGLLLALDEINKASDEQPVSRAAHDAVMKALQRATDDTKAVIEGYTEPPDLS